MTVVDVGSAGGLNPRWQAYAPLLSAILFEPRDSAASGQLGRNCTRVYPVALGANEEQSKLHLTAMPNMSSLLPPHPDLSRYRKKGRHSIVENVVPMPLQRLDSLAAKDGFAPDILKIDTQGSELDVLRGSDKVLASSVVCAEVEVSFFERYKGQPLFADIQSFLGNRGFELIELHRLKRYRANNSLHIGNVGLGRGQRAGRIAYGDAIFMRKTDGILERSAQDEGKTLLRAVVALAAYGKPDMATRLLDDGRSLIAEDIRNAVYAALARTGGSRLGLAHVHAALDWIARKA